MTSRYAAGLELAAQLLADARLRKKEAAEQEADAAGFILSRWRAGDELPAGVSVSVPTSTKWANASVDTVREIDASAVVEVLASPKSLDDETARRCREIGVLQDVKGSPRILLKESK